MMPNCHKCAVTVGRRGQCIAESTRAPCPRCLTGARTPATGRSDSGSDEWSRRVSAGRTGLTAGMWNRGGNVAAVRGTGWRG
jgi:hypothetical protein